MPNMTAPVSPCFFFFAQGRGPCYNACMDKVTLKNFRCFREEQTARLAPLTFLVGENSTGKTSFLALIRALWDVAFAERVPDFREVPFNLGSFGEIVHNRGGRGKEPESFEGGFERPEHGPLGRATFRMVFKDRDANPFPVSRYFESDGVWQEACDLGRGRNRVRQGVLGHQELTSIEVDYPAIANSSGLVHTSWLGLRVAQIADRPPFRSYLTFEERPFAGAPVRSRPLRTYDPTRQVPDPEGQNAPSFLAGLHRRDPDGWQGLKKRLEQFGRASGLFDEITVKAFAGSESAPFQVQVRKFASKGRRKGPQRNLIDVGYGVSQALPLLAELLRSEAARMFLLQQPEVHLHPSAQAALGSLFCEIAGAGQQLIVETHSDYIIDRVTMDIRDGVSSLKSEDVSILYFEPGDLDVRIHSIRIDKYGNILDAPPNYRQFFVRETQRSIGL